jgi:hypothetical protein
MDMDQPINSILLFQINEELTFKEFGCYSVTLTKGSKQRA